MVEKPKSIRVTHFRLIGPVKRLTEAILFTHYDLRRMKLVPAAKGGMTVVHIETEDGHKQMGFAYCSPRDNFSRSKGRAIATGRAWAKIEKARRGESPVRETGLSARGIQIPT